MTPLRSAVLVLALAGVAGAQPPPEISADDARQVLFVFHKVADAMVAHHHDCAKLATELDRLIDANPSAIKRARAAKASGKRLPRAVQEQMLARVEQILPAMQSCGEHAAVVRAMQRLDAPASSPQARK